VVMTFVGEPGWLKTQPLKLSWQAPGRGIYIRDQTGTLLGIAATDAEEDLAKRPVVHLMVFDGAEYSEPFRPAPIERI